jgi:hypothetical protein
VTVADTCSDDEGVSDGKGDPGSFTSERSVLDLVVERFEQSDPGGGVVEVDGV